MSKSAKTIPLAKEPQGKDAGSLLSAWSPLRESVFRALWIATVVSNTIVLIDAEVTEGPAVTIVEYRINPKTADEFLQAMKEMRRIRQRDGAIRWNLLRDTADPQRYLESFVTESWGDHLRQHERVTAENREVDQRAQAFHLGPEPPKITHLIAEELPSESTAHKTPV